MERLAAEYKERIKAQKVAIQYEAHMRDAREEEVSARAVVRRRTKAERSERAEATRIKAEEAGRMEAEGRAAAEAARISAERPGCRGEGSHCCRCGAIEEERQAAADEAARNRSREAS